MIKPRLLYLLFFLIGLTSLSSISQTTETFDTAGTFTWTAPTGVTSVDVEAWGGGGNGGNIAGGNTLLGTGGGGGGAYVKSTLTVVPGNDYTVVEGSFSEDSYFIDQTTLLAEGGENVSEDTAAGGQGGSAANSVGDTKFSGGNGANGSGTSNGGGGGSSAGNSAVGVDGTGSSGGIAPSGGGNGGDGATSEASGSSGTIPGGGGGGSLKTSNGGPITGGTGADGQVDITYTVNSCNLSADVNTVNPTCQNPNTGEINITNPTGATNYEYRLDNGAWQTSSSFSGLVDGTTYDVQIRDADDKTCTESLGNFLIECVVDTDGDGIPDIDDLDDDNDGILDVDEEEIRTTFTYTGADQTFTVPANASKIIAKIWGAGGSGDITSGRNTGGAGGYTLIELDPSVLTSNTLIVTVGEGGREFGTSTAYGNGGAAGTDGSSGGNPRENPSGGGMSAISYVSLTDPNTVTESDLLAIAGGGGSASSFTDQSSAGAGGGTDGGSIGDLSFAGEGGTQNSGGAGSNGNTPGNAGSFLKGGDAIDGSIGSGGGGGGFYGGGSGALDGTSTEGSGGGGSGYLTASSAFISGNLNQGTGSTPPNTGDSDYQPGVGVGGPNGSGPDSPLNDGGNGLVIIYVETIDTDLDGIPDRLDLDSDNDGIADIVEAGGTDADNDGVVDGTFVDGDGDGWSNVFDSDNGGTTLTDADTDSNGDPDRIDLDSDDDGCSDANEYYELGDADGGDGGEFGNSTPSVDANGLVIAAGYNGTSQGLSDSKDVTIGDACVFIQIIDGDWDNSTNWREGAVPTSNDDAIIDDNITSTVTQNQALSSLTLNSGSEVEIDDTFTLNVKGDITNNGEFTSSTGIGNGEVVLDGTANQDLSGDGKYENLRLNNGNGADIISSTVINGVITIDDGTFTTNDDVTFPCDFDSVNNRVGQIGQVSASGSISGDVITEQCLPARRAFRLISSSTTTTNSAVSTIQDNWQEGATDFQDDPVPSSSTPGNFGFGTHITGVNNSQTDNSQNNGFDWQPSGNPSMFTFDESAQDWNTVNNTNTNTLSAGDPYRLMIRGDRSVDITDNATTPTNTKLRSTGTPETGNVQFTNFASGPNDEATLIGNPYHSVVDLESVLNNSSGLQDCIIIWDPTLGGSPTVGQPGGRGAFVTVDVSTNTSCNATSDMDKYLQPYQSFFVFSDGSSNPTLNFTETDKATDQTQLEVFSSEPANFIDVLLYDAASHSGDQTADDGVSFIFSDNFSNAIDSGDYLKVGNQDENLATWSQNTKLLSIERRAMPVDDEELQLYTTQYRATDYVLEFELGSFPDNEVYLYDAHTDQQILLNEDTVNTYSYSVDPSISSSVAWNRFNIIFETETFSISEEELKNEIKLFRNPANEYVNISFGDLNLSKAQIIISDMQGRQIKTIDRNEISTDQIRVNTSNLSQGIYFVRINNDQLQHTAKLIVE